MRFFKFHEKWANRGLLIFCIKLRGFNYDFFSLILLICKVNLTRHSISPAMLSNISVNFTFSFHKSAVEVSNGLIERVFCIFVLLSILHSDNDVIKSTTALWPETLKRVNGISGYSQSQGLVEQGNRTIELMISVQEKLGIEILIGVLGYQKYSVRARNYKFFLFSFSSTLGKQYQRKFYLNLLLYCVTISLFC